MRSTWPLTRSYKIYYIRAARYDKLQVFYVAPSNWPLQRPRNIPWWFPQLLLGSNRQQRSFWQAPSSWPSPSWGQSDVRPVCVPSAPAPADPIKSWHESYAHSFRPTMIDNPETPRPLCPEVTVHRSGIIRIAWNHSATPFKCIIFISSNTKRANTWPLCLRSTACLIKIELDISHNVLLRCIC